VAKKAVYGDNPLVGSEAYYSSTPINKKGKWFVEMEKRLKKMQINIFLKSQCSQQSIS